MLIYPEIETNQSFQQSGIGFEGTWGQSAAASFQEAITYNPLSSYNRMHELEYRKFLDPSPHMTQKEWKESEHFREGLSFPEGVKQNVAKLIAERKDDENQRRFVINSGPKGFTSKAGLFGVQIVAAILDPVNTAAAFIPVLREARFAKLVASIGLTKARFVKGGVEGAIGAAVVEPVVLAAAHQEQADYGMTDSLYALGFGSVFGAGLHAGAGKIGDIMRKYSDVVDEPAYRAATAAAIEGKPAKVDGLYRIAEIPETKLARDVELEFDKLHGKEPVVSRSQEQLKLDSVDINARITKAEAKVLEATSARVKKQRQKQVDELKTEKKSVDSRIEEIDTKLKEIKKLDEKIKRENDKKPTSKKGKEAKAKRIEKLESEQAKLKSEIEPKPVSTVRQTVRDVLRERDEYARVGDTDTAQRLDMEAQDIIAGERGFPRFESDEAAVRDAEVQADPKSDSMYDERNIQELDDIAKRQDNDRTVDSELEELDSIVMAVRDADMVDEASIKAYNDADQLIKQAEQTDGIMKAIAMCAVR